MNHALLIGEWDVDCHHFKFVPDCLKLNKLVWYLKGPWVYKHESHIRVICIEIRKDTWITGKTQQFNKTHKYKYLQYFSNTNIYS